MMLATYTTTWSAAGEVAATSLLLLAGIIVVVRLAGLRSFAKMSSTDFAITVAIGSILGGVATSSSVPLVHGIIAAATLLAAKTLVAFGRRRGFDSVVDNKPIVVMVGSDFVDENLRQVNISRDDIYAKLREANVLRMDSIQAVVFEATGDVSVLHGDEAIDAALLGGVRDADRVPTR